MIIRNDHFYLTSAQDIKEIANPLSSLGISYFGYSRHYHDGGRLWLCNNANNMASYFSNHSYHVGNTEAHPSMYSAQVVLWSTLPNQDVFGYLKQQGVSDGIFIIEPQKDFCDFIALGILNSNPSAINTFLTKIEFLKKFTDYFKEKAKRIIKTGELNKIYLPYHNRKLPTVDEYNQSTTLNFLSQKKLSPRQHACAKLILQGKTIKEIARSLSLSPRTIEAYLNDLKTKLNALNKTDLIAKLVRIIEN